MSDELAPELLASSLANFIDVEDLTSESEHVRACGVPPTEIIYY